jgi:hypothetical protein
MSKETLAIWLVAETTTGLLTNECKVCLPLIKCQRDDIEIR